MAEKDDQGTDDVSFPSKDKLLGGSDDNDINNEHEPDGNDDDNFTDEEREALAQGWNPDFVGPNKRSAREYLDRSSFFKKIESQKDRIRTQDTRIAKMDKQMKFLLERNKEANRLLAESTITKLKQQKAEAMDEQEHARVIELDDQIAEAHRARAAADAEYEELMAAESEDDFSSKEGPDPEEVAEYEQHYAVWADRNKWYTDSRLQKIADTAATRFLKTSRDAGESPTPLEVLMYVEDYMVDRYDVEVGKAPAGKRQQKGNAVEGAGAGRRSSRTSRKPKHTSADLSGEDRMVMRNMIRSGMVESEEAYIAQLEEVGFFD